MRTASERRWKGFAAGLALFLAGALLPLLPSLAAGQEPPKPAAKDKCPVCGMFVAKYPDWVMAVSFKDGSHAFFDGAKDLFKYLLDMKRYEPRRKAEDIRAILVKDYYRLSWVRAQDALYVTGSDVYGPMGRELIPMEKEADAREFLKDHRGTGILRFGGVTKEVLRTLD